MSSQEKKKLMDMLPLLPAYQATSVLAFATLYFILVFEKFAALV